MYQIAKHMRLVVCLSTGIAKCCHIKQMGYFLFNDAVDNAQIVRLSVVVVISN